MKRKIILGVIAAAALTAGGLGVISMTSAVGLAAPPPAPGTGHTAGDPADCPMFDGDTQGMPGHMGPGAMDLPSMQQRMDAMHGAGSWDRMHGPNGAMPLAKPTATP